MSSQLNQKEQLLPDEHKAVKVNDGDFNHHNDFDKHENGDTNSSPNTARKMIPDSTTPNNEKVANKAEMSTDSKSKKREMASDAIDSNDQTPMPKKRARKATSKAQALIKDNKSSEVQTEPTKKPATKSKKSNQGSTHDQLNMAENKKIKSSKPETPSPKKTGTESPQKSAGMTVRNTPRQRAAPKNANATGRRIPSSLESADEADRMLVEWKDNGKKWPEIRKEYEEMIGSATGDSTLPNRYERIKANITPLKGGDAIRLLQAKRKADGKFWGTVADEVKELGGQEYKTFFLQKKYKQLESEAAAANISLDAYFASVAQGNAAEEAPADEELTEVADSEANDAQVESSEEPAGPSE
ncbi:hypothetical protein ACLMJK_001720 [Lecanora helva]